MSQGEYTLQQQRGAKGYYGKIRFVVQPQETSDCSVRYAETCALRWRIGIDFGVTYGWEQSEAI
jgi:hypothetical protein